MVAGPTAWGRIVGAVLAFVNIAGAILLDILTIMSTLPPLNVLNVLLATLPILVVLYLMIGRSWGGSEAGLAGWAAAMGASLLFFGANPLLLLVASGRAVLLSLFVLYIIWMALLLYHTVNEAGVITAIGRTLPGIAHDQPAQALLLAWIFGSFLQGATGFGVPAAVVAPLLLGIGFAPNTAVVAALVGHAWSVTYGSLGSSFLSLMAVTGLPGEVLAGPAALALGLCCLGCGVAVLVLTGGKTAVRQRGLFMLVLTVVMGATQWGLAVAGFWTLAALGSALAGLVAAILFLTYRTNRAPAGDFAPRKLLTAFFPYLILIGVIALGQLVFQDALDRVTLNLNFPAVATRFGWSTPAGAGRSISLFGHGGALLLYASLLTYGWYRWRGPLPEARTARYDGRLIWRKTVKGWIKPTIGIYTLVAMALTMEHAGMTQMLAQALSRNTGPLFPFLSPFLGALGAFMTGSNTNSNVVFGELQQQTALALNLSVPLILAAQTAGGAIGGLFAPAKVIVGCSTVPGAEEGPVLKAAVISGLLIIAVLGGVVWYVSV